jgi:tetratricopeptide (TPR) repeat protein
MLDWTGFDEKPVNYRIRRRATPMSLERWIPAAALGMASLLVCSPSAVSQETADPTTSPPAGHPVDETLAEEEPESPRADLTEAIERIRDGDFAAAEEGLAPLQEQFPDDPRLLFMRGEVLLALSRPADALPLLERVAELDGARPRVHFQLATARQLNGDRSGALTAFAKEIETNDDVQVRVMARLNRALLLEQGQDWSGAAAELEAVLELDPERLEVYGDMASFQLRAGELDKAASSLERGFANGFRSARHHHILGARYYENKAFDAAIRAFRQAIEIDPQLAEAERSLASALDQVGQEQEALTHLRRYIELEPDAPDAQRVSERIQAIENR